MARHVFAAIGLACLVTVVAAAQPAYVPARVYASGRKQFTDLESMLGDLAHANVVLVGEEHDDVNTHHLEAEILEGLALRQADVTLSLEMFERDVQEPLGHFLMGHLTEAQFLQNARPWPNYARDYHPLVAIAVAQHWDVVAADVPRAIAAEVAASGLGVLASKSAADKALFARDIQCPTGDRYFKRFADAMGGHAGTSGGSATANRQSVERFYFAQCLKDETMAESIAQAAYAGSIGGRSAVVVHVTGAFHVEYGDGTTARVKRRLPGKRVVVVAILPVDGIDALDRIAPDAEARARADYLIYTTRTPAAPDTPATAP